MPAMLHDLVVAMHTHPQAMPLAMITMRKPIHGFLFLSYMSMERRLATPLGAGARLLLFD